MPRAPGKICGHPMCHVRVPHGVSYCDEHHAEWQAKRKAQAIKRRRGRKSPYAHLYGSAWRKARREFLAYHPACCVCGAEATVVDHTIPHQGDEYLFWDRGNWRAMCSHHHNQSTARDDGGFGNPMKVKR